MITANRYHDISCGHRVVGHEGKCRNLHGHNYRFHFHIEANNLDPIGRVLDFSMIKERLCSWLEDEWDHKMLIWIDDPLRDQIKAIDPQMVVVYFNPTAENMAEYFVTRVAPDQLRGTGSRLMELTIEETRKCSVTFKF